VLEDILEAGSKRAREAAVDTMLQVRKRIGLSGLV
jgi:hypothetical protein